MHAGADRGDSIILRKHVVDRDWLPKGVVRGRRGGSARRRGGRGRRGGAAALAALLRLEPLGVDGAQRLHQVVVQRHAPRRAPLRALRVAASATR